MPQGEVKGRPQQKVPQQQPIQENNNSVKGGNYNRPVQSVPEQQPIAPQQSFGGTKGGGSKGQPNRFQGIKGGSNDSGYSQRPSQQQQPVPQAPVKGQRPVQQQQPNFQQPAQQSYGGAKQQLTPVSLFFLLNDMISV